MGLNEDRKKVSSKIISALLYLPSVIVWHVSGLGKKVKTGAKRGVAKVRSKLHHTD